MLERVRKGGRGAHQVALTVRATVRRDRLDELRRVLEPIGEQSPIPFQDMAGVHFARLLLLEDSADLDGREIPASLLYMAELDAPLERHVRQLADLGGAGLDAAFGLCEGYPGGAGAGARAAFLREHAIPSQANYVNTVGRTVEQVHREEELRRAIEAFLDRRRGRAARDAGGRPRRDPALRARRAGAGRGRAGARRDRACAGAPARRCTSRAWRSCWRCRCRSCSWRCRSTWWRCGSTSAASRRRTCVRTSSTRSASRAIEDHARRTSSARSASSSPGGFRALTVSSSCSLIDCAARHVYNRGNLAGVKHDPLRPLGFLDDGAG